VPAIGNALGALAELGVDLALLGQGIPPFELVDPVVPVRVHVMPPSTSLVLCRALRSTEPMEHAASLAVEAVQAALQ
jgi:hypothetical protein